MISLLLILSLVFVPDWPQFRGPTGQGVSDERNLPVYGNDLVYICTGSQEPSLLAVRLDGRDDVTKSKIVWKLDRGIRARHRRCLSATSYTSSVTTASRRASMRRRVRNSMAVSHNSLFIRTATHLYRISKP